VRIVPYLVKRGLPWPHACDDDTQQTIWREMVRADVTQAAALAAKLRLRPPLALLASLSIFGSSPRTVQALVTYPGCPPAAREELLQRALGHRRGTSLAAFLLSNGHARGDLLTRRRCQNLMRSLPATADGAVARVGLTKRLEAIRRRDDQARLDAEVARKRQMLQTAEDADRDAP
jgi:hypothetical protein